MKNDPNFGSQSCSTSQDTWKGLFRGGREFYNPLHLNQVKIPPLHPIPYVPQTFCDQIWVTMSHIYMEISPQYHH